MTKTYLKNATWAADGKAYDICLGNRERATSVFIREVLVPNAVAATPAGEMEIPAGATDVRDLAGSGKVLLPALFDLHAKVEIPGCSKRESIIRTGRAAEQGGVWGMVVMPTPGFRFDNTGTLDSFHDVAEQRSAVEMLPAGCISTGMKGEQLAPYKTLASRSYDPIRILTDADHVPSNLLMLHRAMKYASEFGMTFAIRGDVPVLTEKTYMHPSTTSYQLGLHGMPACAEEIGIETLIRLAKDAGAKLHIQTVSTAEGVRIIRRAKEDGLQVTAEAALHHLLYTHENVGDYDTNFKTLPPLRDAADREALIAGVKDGTIDCIVSDHTPCIPFAKKQDFITAPQGMVSLDIFLPLLYTKLVKPGLLDWSDIVRACSVNPARIAGVEGGAPHTLVFDPAASFRVTEETLTCGTLNTPLLESELCGCIIGHLC